MDLRRDQLKNTVRSHRGLIVLVFHADWCASCRTLAPVLQELEKEKKHVLFAKIDVDAEVALAMDFGITSIPTLIFLKDGVPAGQMIGLHPKEDILRMIEENE
ncbi:MAG: thioredoxin family protein [Clostridia bacterium]|nr:thioredoxin family protein [Clostridia bacterium]